MTLIPELTTLPSTRAARNDVRFHSANGTRTKPARLVSLNSNIVMKSWIARMKKAAMTITQAITSTAISTKLLKKSIGPTSSFACSSKGQRSEEHTSELQSLMRISYAVFCLKKKKSTITT